LEFFVYNLGLVDFFLTAFLVGGHYLKIEIIGRHENNSPEVREYAQEKAKKVLKYFKNITKVEVILDTEKDKHSAEMIISATKGTQLVGQVVHPDIHAAIDLLVDKMERQLVRFKERLKDHRGNKRDSTIMEIPDEADDEKTYDDIIREKYKGDD
jgi:putative sigma-54 modulation protein